MEKLGFVFGDVATFGLIAIVASLFGFSHAGVEVTLIGRTICFIALVSVGLSTTVKHPPSL
jgi:hypothetical protein